MKFACFYCNMIAPVEIQYSSIGGTVIVKFTFFYYDSAIVGPSTPPKVPMLRRNLHASIVILLLEEGSILP